MTPIRVLGLGSPFGDDRVGWITVENLMRSDGFRALPEGFASAEICDPVGNNLLDAMRGARLAILIDAVRSGAAAGTIMRLNAQNLEDGTEPCSSHGFGLSATLALGRALNDLPQDVVLFLVEVPADAGFGPAENLSEPVAMAIPDLTAAVLNEIAEWTAHGAQ
ncbi:hydrogenase maturation protease [Methylocaldum szegediense]|uniref:Hydrogenase maturation protease n=1 Tax=Methylocaldum szegediense TaxID=73780 RepID=A0ABN8WZ98_9GAMM|nr:hydrogenase maturation protease [Methylocaldum szegediense]CAI8732865.1 Hydrogenase maturation protease [Methylocaldum szegediense]